MALRSNPLLLAALFNRKACGGTDETLPTVDDYVATLARERGIKVKSIEDAKVSLQMISSMPHEAKLNAIETAINDLEGPAPCADGEAVLKEWINADLAAMDARSRKMESDNSALGRYMYEVMVRTRDARMAELLISELARQDRIMVTVGTSHLLGKGSVIDRLAASGATVERIY